MDQKSLQNNNNDVDDNDINKQNGKQMQVNEKNYLMITKWY